MADVAAPPVPGFAPGDVIACGGVASVLRVDTTTVTRWDDAGKLPALLRTPAGHRRWHRLQVEAVRNGLRAPVISLELPELVTTAEVCAAFGVTQVTVRQWVRDGLLPKPVRLPGGHFRHRGADVEAIMRGEKPE